MQFLKMNSTKTQNSILILLILSIISGCIPSLNSLYTEKDLVFNPALIGTWKDGKSMESWKFEKDGENAYQLTFKEGKKSSTFQSHLVKLGDYLFMDLYPKPTNSANSLYQMHIFPVHTFSRIKISNNQLIIEMLNPAWVKNGLKSNQLSISHSISNDGNILLTASTSELQSFLLKHADSKDAFKDEITLFKK